MGAKKIWLLGRAPDLPRRALTLWSPLVTRILAGC